MTKKQEIKIFEDKKVRTVWDSETEQWYFCVVDVVEVLTDSKNPTDYIKKMKKRDPSLAEGWGQIVTPLSVQTATGKQDGQVCYLVSKGKRLSVATNRGQWGLTIMIHNDTIHIRIVGCNGSGRFRGIERDTDELLDEIMK